MNFSCASPQHNSLAQALQYERVAAFEAVLTLRDKRNLLRKRLIGWSTAIAVMSSAVAMFFL